MNNKLKKCIISSLVGLSFGVVIMPVFSKSNVYASEINLNSENSESVNFMNQLKEIVDDNLVVKDSKLFLSNQEYVLSFINDNISSLPDEYHSSFEVLNDINEKIENINNEAKKIGNFLDEDGSVKSYYSDRNVAGVVTSQHWWGYRHEALTDDIAREMARGFEIAAQKMTLNGITVGVISHFFPPVWIATLMAAGGSWYLNGITSSIRYNMSLSGSGVVLDINYWLTYACYPRK